MSNSLGNFCAATRPIGKHLPTLTSVERCRRPCRPGNSFGNAMNARQRPLSGTCAPFVDPRLTALEAPVSWLPEIGAITLNATAIRAGLLSTADLDLSALACIRHIVVECGDADRLLIHATSAAIAIDLRGDRILDSPVNVTFHVDGIAKATVSGAVLMQLPRVLNGPPRHVIRSVRRNLLRNALIALDGKRAGASYREMASVAFGRARATTAWNSSSRAMKDQMIRAHDKGTHLAHGGYQRLFR